MFKHLTKSHIIWPFLLLILTTLLVFGSVTKTFYQQDEWHGLGDVLSLGFNSVSITIAGPISLLFGGGRLLSNLLVYFFYSRYPFNLLPISLTIIFLHAVDSILVYLLAYKFTKKVIPSFLGAIFFIINSVSSGSVIWPASGLSTLPSIFFILLSLLYFLEYLAKNKKRLLIITFVCLYVSLFFKETAVPLFFLLPLSSLLFKKIPFKKFIKIYWIFFSFSFLLIFYRLIQFENITTKQDLFITGASNSVPLTLVVRAIMYPLTSFSLIYIPSETILTITKHITWVYYPFFPKDLYDLVAQTAILDILALFASFFIFTLLYFLFKKAKSVTKKYIIFVTILILLSYLPYIIISKSYSYLESRYYYTAAIGAGLLIALCVKRILDLKKTKLFALLFLLIPFYYLHLKIISSQIDIQVSRSQERLQILNNFLKETPFLDKKTIFYISGNQVHYVSEGNYLPMQQGMGYTLLVWYEAHQKAPAELLPFIRDHYLWELIGGQGYKEINGFGFGYFWDLEKLKEVVFKNKLTKDNIQAFYYDSEKEELKNIKDEVLKKL
ncbi:MAG: hypothetical protein HY044_02950 [Candidatus Woesebacteria bacterium]|nr:MAG: hypothetical protein HY044_02950 [Candidatus Woesebacteria bacterium]